MPFAIIGDIVTGGQVDRGAEGVEMVEDEARGWGLGARIGRFGGEERCAVEVLARLEKAFGAAACSGLQTPSVPEPAPGGLGRNSGVRDIEMTGGGLRRVGLRVGRVLGQHRPPVVDI